MHRTQDLQYAEKSLLKDLQGGSKTAFEKFYRQEYIAVFYTARRFITDIQAAEDLTTETFLKLWERLDAFNSLPAMRSFLFVTIKNACLNHLRAEKRTTGRQQQLSYLLEQEGGEDIANQQLMAVIYQHLEAEIEKLSPQLKRVFKMAYIDGMSNEDIATALGINNQSVRNDKARALKQLRLAFAGKDMYALLLWWLITRLH